MANALKYSINNKEISFSSKSLTIDGKEYLYKDITAIKHSSAKCLYLFKVDGKWNELSYDEAHKKGVTTIFKKVADHLVAVKKAKAAKEVEAIETTLEAKPEPAVEETVVEEPPAVEEVPSLIEALVQNQGIAEETAEEEIPAEETVEETSEEETPVEKSVEEAPAEEVVAEEEAPAEEAAPVEEVVAEKPTVNESSEEEETSEEAPAEEETSEEAPAEEPKAEELDKKAKKKKAFIIFAAIIALFIIAGVAYFFTIGLPSESAPADGQDTTHQYNDIDELIDEMQE